MFQGTIEQAAAEAEKLLSSIAAGAVCVPQHWDQRVDCVLKLPDGSVVGEMVPLTELTERRVVATGERLLKRAQGIDVPLVNELRASTRILPT